MTLPLRAGKAITLLRKSSVVQKDGSITWTGTVEETGERAVLMLWGNAMLTGYLAYNGTIFTIESLGGGVVSSDMVGPDTTNGRGHLAPSRATMLQPCCALFAV